MASGFWNQASKLFCYLNQKASEVFFFWGGGGGNLKLKKYCKTKSLQIYVNQKPFTNWSEEVKSAKTSIADNNELKKHEID